MSKTLGENVYKNQEGKRKSVVEFDDDQKEVLEWISSVFTDPSSN
jgi:hypothetical protein